MTKEIEPRSPGDIVETVLLKNDLSKLTSSERVDYYNQVCKSLGLNPLTMPFSYITLNGRLTLYALRTCTDQLRKINGVTLEIVSQTVVDDILTIKIRASTPDGRSDEDIGAVAFPPALRGEVRANVLLRCITKAKRRATLSICGLGWLDETEIDGITRASQRPNLPPLRNQIVPGEDMTPPPSTPIGVTAEKVAGDDENPANVKPYRIAVNSESDWRPFGETLMRFIRTASDMDAIAAWLDANRDNLDVMNHHIPKLHATLLRGIEAAKAERAAAIMDEGLEITPETERDA